MCFATVAIGAAVIGTAVSAYGAIQQGEAAGRAADAQAQMSRYQAEVARNNQQIAKNMADREIAAGQAAAQAESMKTAARVAKLRAGMAAHGVDVSTGSAVDVQSSERKMGALDAETVLANAQVKAYGYQSKAYGYGADAGLYDTAGANASATASASRTGGYLKAAGTLLSSASQLPAGWFGGGSGTGSMGGNFPSAGQSWNAGPV